MSTDILEKTQTETLLIGLPAGTTIGAIDGRFKANCYEPNDVIRGVQCFGSAPTLAEAIADMLAEREKALTAAPVLRTAAECKAHVQALIREHKAAPPSFRDAVDEIRTR